MSYYQRIVDQHKELEKSPSFQFACKTSAVLSKCMPEDNLDMGVFPFKRVISLANFQIDGLQKLSVDPISSQLITSLNLKPENYFGVHCWNNFAEEYKKLKEMGITGIALAFSTAVSGNSILEKTLFNNRLTDLKEQLPEIEDINTQYLLASVIHPYLKPIQPNLRLIPELTKAFKEKGINDDLIALILAAKFVHFTSVESIENLPLEMVVDHINLLSKELKISTFDAMIIAISPLHDGKRNIPQRYGGDESHQMFKFTKEVFDKVTEN
jgi:hypothetical protein